MTLGATGSYVTAQNISTLHEMANKILRKCHACSADVMDGRKLTLRHIGWLISTLRF